MVDQTYLPNKTVTLKDDNLISTNPGFSIPKINVAVKDNYLSHKTVNITISEIAEKIEAKPNTDQTNSLTNASSSSSSISAKDNYSSLKTANIVDAITTEKSEEKPKEDNLNIVNKPPSPSLNLRTNDNYSFLKTVNIIDSITSEKKEEKPKIDQWNNADKISPSTLTNDSKGNYLSHKTVNLAEGVIIPKAEEKSVDSNIHIEIKSTTTKEELTIVQRLSPDSDNSIQVEYSEHKSVSVSNIEVASIEALKKQEINTPSPINDRGAEKENYPSYKTVTINAAETIPTKKDLEGKPIISLEIKSVAITNIKATGHTIDNYPDNKSYTFVKEDYKTLPINAAISTSVKNEEIAVPLNNKPQTAITSVKAKKTVFWMVLSIVLFFASATTGWLSYHSQNSFNEELILLKQNNDNLTDSIKKLQKDKLHFDDLIIRGGKIDTQNNIMVVNAATESEAIRICFSIGSNQYAAKGKKVVYIRLIDPNNHVLLKTKENLFEYRGNQIPFSLKEEVEYLKAEMMLCFDYKLEEKLQKGLYKAEIYNDGVLDGTGTFELK